MAHGTRSLDKGLGERREGKTVKTTPAILKAIFVNAKKKKIVEQLCLPLETTQPTPKGSFPERSVPELLEVYQIINLQEVTLKTIFVSEG